VPRTFFYRDKGVWAKQCSCCFETTLGTADLKESIEIISQMFSPDGEAAQMHDGLQSRCWICNSMKRRALGITRQQLESMMQAQDSKCLICCEEISITRNSPNPANVDHDENSGEIRGLLCGNCNRAIGLLKHDPTLLRCAATYCSHYSKVIKLRGNNAA
jgi:hypothetical protein